MQDFSFIKDEHTRRIVANGYEAVDKLELWSWLKAFDAEGGFMFCSHPNVSAIGNKMESLENPPGHSGFSFAFTMRHLEYIAKNGLDEYKQFMAR